MSEDIKKGLLGIVVDETTISHVVPELSALTYRGYTVQELCDKCDFEEVAYLVLHGELPNKAQLKKFIKEERSERKLSKQILNDIQKMPKNAHPMDVIRTCVSLMALEDKDTKDNSPKANMRKAMRIFAKTPTAVAAYFRSRKGKKIISPDKKLSFSENFFKMMFNKVPDKEIVRAFDISLILYAEHSFNVSTFTARTITSSLSDIHSAITGAIGSVSENIEYPYLSEDTNDNPWQDRFETREDYALSDIFVAHLSNHNDPRITEYAELPASGGDYTGVPYGVANPNVLQAEVSFIDSDIIYDGTRITGSKNYSVLFKR